MNFCCHLLMGIMVLWLVQHVVSSVTGANFAGLKLHGSQVICWAPVRILIALWKILAVGEAVVCPLGYHLQILRHQIKVSASVAGLLWWYNYFWGLKFLFPHVTKSGFGPCPSLSEGRDAWWRLGGISEGWAWVEHDFHRKVIRGKDCSLFVSSSD